MTAAGPPGNRAREALAMRPSDTAVATSGTIGPPGTVKVAEDAAPGRREPSTGHFGRIAPGAL